MTRVVVVGAGLGGLRTAESLRASGYADSLTIIGDEPHLPYNRPPLSKEALKEGVDVESLAFRRRASLDDVDWVTGNAAVASDFAAQTVTLTDGTVLSWDGLVIASGIRPRPVPAPGPERGRYRLRTVSDAEKLREQLNPGTRLVIIGAGFIGCEVAATATDKGCDVTIVALDPEPMVRPLGIDVGASMRRRHEEHGVTFHLGRSVHEYVGDENVSGLRIDDGTVIDADVVLEAIGSVANVEWLTGNGLDLSDGVLVDDALRVIDTDRNVVAVGDIARYANHMFDDVPRRIEHWNLPTETGRRAGKTLAALLAGESVDAQPYSVLPAFWSDQYDVKIQSYGLPGIADEHRVVEGNLDGDCIVEYLQAGRVVGVVGFNRIAELTPYRSLISGS